jgi:hypothetical protein
MLSTTSFVLSSCKDRSSVDIDPNFTGLWLPLAGALIALIEWLIAVLRYQQSDNLGSFVFLAAVAAVLVMLGPSAYSRNAQVFGRKLILGKRKKQDEFKLP